MQHDEIREIERGLVVQWFKGKNNNFVLNTQFNRKPVQSMKDQRYMWSGLAQLQISWVMFWSLQSGGGGGGGHKYLHTFIDDEK